MRGYTNRNLQSHSPIPLVRTTQIVVEIFSGIPTESINLDSSVHFMENRITDVCVSPYEDLGCLQHFLCSLLVWHLRSSQKSVLEKPRAPLRRTLSAFGA